MRFLPCFSINVVIVLDEAWWRHRHSQARLGNNLHRSEKKKKEEKNNAAYKNRSFWFWN